MQWGFAMPSWLSWDFEGGEGAVAVVYIDWHLNV